MKRSGFWSMQCRYRADHTSPSYILPSNCHASYFLVPALLHLSSMFYSLLYICVCCCCMDVLISSFSHTVLHTIKFQKRGLPHAHIILWVMADTSNPTPAVIDKHVSAEIPDPKTDPLGYALVAEHMVHGLCGSRNPRCPCMKKERCSKFYKTVSRRDFSQL